MTTGRGQEDRGEELQSPAVRLGALEGKIDRLIRFGTIAQINYDIPAVRVQIGGNLTDWLRWLGDAGGTEGGSEWKPPVVGEQVTVLSPGGDFSQGVALRGLYQTSKPAPAKDPKVTVRTFADGAVEMIDHQTKTHSLTIPAGGRFIVTVGDSSALEISDTQAILEFGEHRVTVDATGVVTDGTTRLNGGIRPLAFAGSTTSGGNTLTDGGTGKVFG